MGIRQDVDDLMCQMKVTEEMHRAIMEGRKMKDHKRFSFRKAAVSVAAALLVSSTMYVGAGYIMEGLPLRELFMRGGSNVVTVPESQRMPEIYGEADSHMAENEIGEIKTEVPMGKYGELIIDNELFSIELLENDCLGRELYLSYILTYKTDERMTVSVTVGTEYYGELLDGPSDVPADSSRMLLDNAFGERMGQKDLPEDCIYELEENQELWSYTMLAKEDYRSGIYQLYAEYIRGVDLSVDYSSGEVNDIELLPGISSCTGHTYFKAPIEIIGNDNYGIALSGTTDKTEGDVHFDTYEVYVSPWNVYLTLDGTYQGEMSAIWGAKSSHEVVIGFKDGTEACTTVRLSSMSYGFGDIEVSMRASFDTAIDPQSIASVMLDGVMIMGEQ